MNIEDMDVFKLSHELTLEVYKITKNYPKEEMYGLTSQMRRASYSVPMNLMEGGHRFGKKEYMYFVGISRGSAGEAKYQLLLSKDLKYIDEDTYSKLRKGYDRVSMMLTKLHSSLQ